MSLRETRSGAIAFIAGSLITIISVYILAFASPGTLISLPNPPSVRTLSGLIWCYGAVAVMSVSMSIACLLIWVFAVGPVVSRRGQRSAELE